MAVWELLSHGLGLWLSIWWRGTACSGSTCGSNSAVGLEGWILAPSLPNLTEGWQPQGKGVCMEIPPLECWVSPDHWDGWADLSVTGLWPSPFFGNGALVLCHCLSLQWYSKQLMTQQHLMLVCVLPSRYLSHLTACSECKPSVGVWILSEIGSNSLCKGQNHHPGNIPTFLSKYFPYLPWQWDIYIHTYIIFFSNSSQTFCCSFNLFLNSSFW